MVTAGFFVFAGAGVSWAELKNVPMRVKRISVVSFFVGVANYSRTADRHSFLCGSDVYRFKPGIQELENKKRK